MLVTRDTEDGRILHFIDIPTTFSDPDGSTYNTPLQFLSVKLQYVGDNAKCIKGITLDDVVIPAILRAINTGEKPT